MLERQPINLRLFEEVTDREMEEAGENLHLSRTLLLDALQKMKQAVTITTLRRELIALKNDVFNSASPIRSDITDDDVVEFIGGHLREDFDQIVSAQTIERAVYYIDRLIKGVVVVSRMAWYTAGDQSRERFDTMVTMLITCRHCGSPDLTKYGIAPNRKQKYRCRTCGRQSRENPGSAAYAPERKEEILRAYQERSSLRGLERTFGVARSTVISWLKKSPLPPAPPNDLDRP